MFLLLRGLRCDSGDGTRGRLLRGRKGKGCNTSTEAVPVVSSGHGKKLMENKSSGRAGEAEPGRSSPPSSPSPKMDRDSGEEEVEAAEEVAEVLAEEVVAVLEGLVMLEDAK